MLVAISPESAYVAAFWNSGLRDSRSTYVKTLHLCAAQNAEITQPQQVWARQFDDWIFDLRSKARINFSSDSAILATVTQSKAQIFDVVTGAYLQECALHSNDIRLLSFDTIKGRIFTTHSIFYKTSSWKHWQASPRLGYFWDYLRSDGRPVEDKWTLDGKMNCYLPSNFRPSVLTSYDRPNPLAMSDSLLVVVNELREVVIIRFPTPREARQQENEIFDVAPAFESTIGSAGSSHLVVNVSLERKSGSKSPIRKRSASNELRVEDQSNGPSTDGKKGKKNLAQKWTAMLVYMSVK